MLVPKTHQPSKYLGTKKAFIFKIESTGALPAERIVIEAVKILDKKVKEFSNQLKKGKQK